MQWLNDCKHELIYTHVLGYNPNSHATTPISQENLPHKNYYIGQIEILSLLTNLEYEVIRQFYIETKEVKDGEVQLDTDE